MMKSHCVVNAAMCSAACLVMGVAGCTSNEPVELSSSVPSNISPQAKTMFDDAFADPELSDFERTVLSDWRVTDEEASEAKDRYVQCMADHGWIASIDDTWQTKIVAAPGSGNENRDVDDNGSLCMPGILDYIEPIYLEERNNPEGLTYVDQIRACFSKNNLPDGNGLSDDQIQQMAFDPNADLHPGSAQAYWCTMNPSGWQGGVSLSSAQQYFDQQSKEWGMAEPSGSPS